MSWVKAELGDHVDILVGAAFKSKFFTDNPDDIPLIKGENIGQGQILWDKSRYWSRNDLDGYQKYFLNYGDVILAMDRPWVTAGLKYAFISKSDPQALLVQRVACIRGINGLLQNFLRCIIASNEFSSYIKMIMGGTNVPHISADQIKSL
jgi:type I restriction enzyme S subunit